MVIGLVKSPSLNATEESNDVWFNPYRQPRTPEAIALIDRVVAEIQTHEKRTRARKTKDRETFDAIASALISDIVYFYLSRHPVHVGLTLSRANDVLGAKSRYRPKFYKIRPPFRCWTFSIAAAFLLRRLAQRWTQSPNGEHKLSYSQIRSSRFWLRRPSCGSLISAVMKKQRSSS